MIYEQVNLSAKGQAPDTQMQLYLLSNSEEIEKDRRRPIVLILPGGGYRYLSFREEEPVAIRMLSLGYHAAVLRYSVAPTTFPAQLLQTMAAIHQLRSRADEWHIRADRIIVMGFSAGGHLAASAGVFWSKPYYASLLGLEPDDVRPDALALCYPVITSGPYAHQGSIDCLTGDPNSPFRDTVSLEKQAGPRVPPCFIWHTVTDAAVPVENSMMFASALRKHEVPFELHLFSSGSHGLSLSNNEVYGPERADSINKACQQWVELFDAWMKAFG